MIEFHCQLQQTGVPGDYEVCVTTQGKAARASERFKTLSLRVGTPVDFFVALDRDTGLQARHDSRPLSLVIRGTSLPNMYASLGQAIAGTQWHKLGPARRGGFDLVIG
jgi:hypothetical protein